jgi:hypothetical protein
MQIPLQSFTVPSFNEDVLSHKYHLHQDLRTTTRTYGLHNFLQKVSRELKPATPPPPQSAG